MKTKQQFHIKRVHFSHAQDFDLVIGDGRDHDRVTKMQPLCRLLSQLLCYRFQSSIRFGLLFVVY